VCSLPITGGISAGLLSGLLPVAMGQSPAFVGVSALVTALLVRTPAALRWRMLPWLAVLTAGSWWLHPTWAMACTIPLAAAIAWLLAPEQRRPVGCATLLNTCTGHPVFLAVCVALPLLQPLLWLCGRHRDRCLGAVMRCGGWLVLHSACFVRWQWRCDHPLPPGPWVLISNHRSVADILTCLAIPGRRRLLLAKSWVFRLPFLGWAARLGGMLPMAALDAGRITAFPADCDLVIFPEGTRSSGPDLGRFRSGAVQAACDLNRPLVVACQFGSGAVLGRHDPWIRPGVIMSILAVPELAQTGTRVSRSAELRTWMAQRLTRPPAVAPWLDWVVRWESAAQQGLAARWRALHGAHMGKHEFRPDAGR
jgi:1-acyl-sn-glycerol-3-phosphate acyltransferase